MLLGERALAPGSRHAASLLRAIDGLLGEADRALDQVDSLALSIGPGSFTSLRIGLATALGLCFGTPRRIVPVPTLAALSLAAADDAARIGVLLDARKSQVYAGLYAPGGVALAADCVTSAAEWAAAIPGAEPVCLLGPGVGAARPELEAALGARARFAPPVLPRAAWVAQLGARGLAEGKAQPPEQVELAYLRPPDAERARLAGQRDSGLVSLPRSEKP